jgi:hypothetical protein
VGSGFRVQGSGFWVQGVPADQRNRFDGLTILNSEPQNFDIRFLDLN